jgi:hypothetical protein
MSMSGQMDKNDSIAQKKRRGETYVMKNEVGK